MRWQVSIAGLLVIAAVALTACAGAATSQEPVPPDIPREDGRLLTHIIAYGVEGYKICYYDADVALQDGRIRQVVKVGEAARDRVRPGVAVAGLPAGMDTGRTIPAPVYVGEDGNVHGSYDYCEPAP